MSKITGTGFKPFTPPSTTQAQSKAPLQQSQATQTQTPVDNQTSQQGGNQFQSFQPSVTGRTQSFSRDAPALQGGGMKLPTSLRSMMSAAQAAGGRQFLKQDAPTEFGGNALRGTGLSGGTGAQGLNDPNVTPARQHARQVQGQRVDWNNRAGILDNMSQIDSNQGVHQGGNDAVRCGAASLVAGSVLQGPQNFQQGLGRVHSRGQRLLQQLQNSSTYQDQNGNSQSVTPGVRSALNSGVVGPLRQSLQTIQTLQGRDPSTLTNGDMNRLQEAMYQVAIVDQRTTASGQYSVAQERIGATPPSTRNDFLTTGTMQTYRDTMWGGQSPQMNGRSLDINWISNGQGGGHYVLADNQPSSRTGGRMVAFNPWPESDGTAFSRGVDGGGVSVRSMGSASREHTVQGLDVDNDSTARRLPNR